MTSSPNKKLSEEKSNSPVTVVSSEVVGPSIDLKVVTQEETSKLSQYLQTAEDYESYIQKRTKTRARKSAFQFFSFVLTATLLAALYYGIIASNRYVSVFQFTIESSRQTASAALQGILGQIGGNTVGKETNVLSEYLKSPVILDKMDEWLNVRAHYQDENIDIISRLPKNASREEFLDYYRNLIDIDATSTSDVITVKVQAFDPHFAAAMGDAMVTLSEELINNLNAKAIEDAIRYSRRDLKEAEKRFSLVQKESRAFQNKERDLDPQQSAATVLGIVSMLEAQLAQTKSQLTETLSFMRSDSIQVLTTKAKILALEKQIFQEKEKLAGATTQNKRNYTDKLNDFSRIRMNEEFALRAYEASITSLELAKSEATRKFSYIVAFVPASLPDSSTEPQRFFSILTVFLGASGGFMLLTFLWGTIRDHIDS